MIAPENLLPVLVRRALYIVRNERQLMNLVDYNPPFRWFVGLTTNGVMRSPMTFTKNCDRLLDIKRCRRVRSCVKRGESARAHRFRWSRL